MHNFLFKLLDDCRIGNGKHYLGTQNYTESGFECQKWSSQTPHSHDTPPMVFPELQDAENYCRNVGGQMNGPWCYTVDKTVRWEYCTNLIPLCPNSTENIATLDLNNNPKLEMEDVFTPMMMIVIGSIGLVTILIIHVCILLIYRISRYNKREHASAGFTVITQNVDINKLPANINYHQTAANLNPKLEKLEYPRNDIIYIKDLGQGAFGR